MNTELRKNIKKLIIKLGLDNPGYNQRLAKKLEISPSLLSMALTGYRKTPGSEKILTDLFSLLKTLPNPETQKEARGKE